MSEHPAQFFDHAREYRDFRYVYPVISRRSRGLSVGINLNPDKRCNWACVYCQVDRSLPPETTEIDEDRLTAELRRILADVSSGQLWTLPRFADTPESFRRLTDISFAGDGEPTSHDRFAEVVELVISIGQEPGRSPGVLADVGIHLLTNATLFHLPAVRRGLEMLESTLSEIWVKLDAGTEDYFKRVSGSKFSLKHCLENIRFAGRHHTLTIQSLFFQYDGAPTSDLEIDAYIERLKELLAAGTRIQRVQVYTIARSPGDPRCLPLTELQVRKIAQRLNTAIPDLDVLCCPP